jgi:glycosyltransferase involved in cell wall biosynthesis
MKTILIAHNYSENSFASMSFQLAHHLAELGNRVVFISHKPFFKEEQIVKKGVGEIIVLSWSTEKRPTSVGDVFWFVKIYLRYQPETIIGHFVGSNITIAISKLLSLGKTNAFSYYHTLSAQISADTTNSFLINKLLFVRKKLFYKIFCDAIICPSQFAKEDLESFYTVNKGIVVLNPMTDRFNNQKKYLKDKIVISYLGRLDASKGVLDFVLAFNQFKKMNAVTKIIINIAGTGTQKRQLEDVIVNNNSIEYHGGLTYNEIDAYLSTSHFTIIPSKFDNLPTVGIESLMNKTPLLISNTTGLTEYLYDGFECFKFDATIESMIELFERVEKNFKGHEEMSNNARITYLNSFSMNQYFENITNLIL